MELQLQPLNLPSDQERAFIIAGPCSAETEEQVITTAKQLAGKGCHIFRAGVWKPRTKPGGFEGHGEPALPWMARVKKETGMLVATEVATPKHVELALKYGIDILWIGARTTANPFAVQELADALKGTNATVLVKNPLNPDLELWIGALLRIQAMDLGFDGLIVESHCDPDKAWSDASQQVTPEVLDFIVSRLIFRDTSEHTDRLKDLRKEIDEIDNDLIDLLAKRMKICRSIGEYKKENGMTIVQTRRYSEILDKRGAQGSLLGIDTLCIKNIFEHIHEESVRQQMEIINK